MVVRLLLLLLSLLLTGCQQFPLPGLADVALEYQASGETEAPALKRAILARLGAARIAADVDVESNRVRVEIDGQTESLVRELLRWSGGVTLHELVEGEPGEPDREEPADRAEAVARSLDGKTPGARALIEPLGPDRARLRWVREVPRATLDAAMIARVEVGGDGRSLVFDLDLHGDVAVRGAVAAALADKTLVVRDTTVLGPLDPRTEASFEVLAGTGLYAYTRADRVRALLATPALPKLDLVSSVRLPFAPATFAVGLLLPLVLSLAWLAFVRRFDRLHPEPTWLVGLVFVMGALSVIPAAVLEIAWARSSLALNPTYATMGGRLVAFPYALFVFTLVVGLSEEGSKLAAALIVRRRREFDEPIDGIVYGVAAALGFAAMENAKYFAIGRLAPSLVLARTFTSIPAHLLFGAIWGYALGQTLLPGRSKWIVVKALGVAALLHGAFDALLSTRGLAPLALLVNLGLASAFVVLVQTSLRRGAVDRDVAPLSHDRQTVIRVGSPVIFWLGAVGVHAGALASVVLGFLYEASGARPGPWFFLAATFSLAVVIASAWAVSAALPLDVVVDAHGVTFAGSLRRWELIDGIARVRAGPMAYLEVSSSEGALRIGPVRPTEAATLDALLASRVPRS